MEFEPVKWIEVPGLARRISITFTNTSYGIKIDVDLLLPETTMESDDTWS